MTGLLPFSRDFPLMDDFWTSSPKYSPAVDIVDETDAYLVLADLPGIKPDDIHVSAHQRSITISGARKIEKRLRGERIAGGFSRTILLSKNADMDRIEASIQDGVLTVRVPKNPEAQPKRIPIKDLTEKRSLIE